jgi:hypothetical protein
VRAPQPPARRRRARPEPRAAPPPGRAGGAEQRSLRGPGPGAGAARAPPPPPPPPPAPRRAPLPPASVASQIWASTSRMDASGPAWITRMMQTVNYTMVAVAVAARAWIAADERGYHRARPALALVQRAARSVVMLVGGGARRRARAVGVALRRRAAARARRSRRPQLRAAAPPLRRRAPWPLRSSCLPTSEPAGGASSCSARCPLSSRAPT